MACAALRLIVIIVSLFTISACENNDSSYGGTSKDDLSDAKPYKSNSPWADRIQECILAKSVDEACALSRLPLIGMESSNPSVDDVLDRALVSHQWMGERLEILLATLPPELLLLTRSITAIVVDDDIRPAYYDVNTGAIYIDANYLWLDPAEASTINPKEDFRSEFSRPLGVRSFARYVKDNNYAYVYRSPDDPITRSLSDIEYLFASLLLHELAHANDFFPPALHSQLPTHDKPWPTAYSIRQDWVSTRLSESQALSSNTMFGLAGVMYLGDTASDAERAMTPEEVGAEFEPDGASDTYAYSTEREDVAMLFEEAMMYHLFDIERDLTFLTAPEEGSNTCEDYQVGWGSRMRVATSQVSTRAQFVVEEIIPEVDAQTLFNSLPETRFIPTNLNWCTSLGFEQTDPAPAQQKTSLPPSMNAIPYYR